MAWSARRGDTGVLSLADLLLLLPSVGRQLHIEHHLSGLPQRGQLSPIQAELYCSRVAQAQGKPFLRGPFERLTRAEEEPLHGLIVDSDMEPGFCLCLDAQTVWSTGQRLLRQ